MKALRSVAAAALSLLVALRSTIVAYLLRMVPVTVDGAIRSLEAVVARLDRAETRAMAALEAANLESERLLAASDAAGERATLLAVDVARAARVRARVQGLLA